MEVDPRRRIHFQCPKVTLLSLLSLSMATRHTSGSPDFITINSSDLYFYWADISNYWVEKIVSYLVSRINEYITLLQPKKKRKSMRMIWLCRTYTFLIHDA